MPFSNLFDVSKISIFPSSIISFSNYLHSDSLKTENLLPNYFLNFLMANWLQPSIFSPMTDKKMSSLYLRDVLQCLLGSQLCRKFAQKIIGPFSSALPLPPGGFFLSSFLSGFSHQNKHRNTRTLTEFLTCCILSSTYF